MMVMVMMVMAVVVVNQGANEPDALSSVDRIAEVESSEANSLNAERQRQSDEPAGEVPAPIPASIDAPRGGVDIIAEVKRDSSGGGRPKMDRAPAPRQQAVDASSERVPKPREMGEAVEVKSADKPPPVTPPTRLFLRAIPPISVAYLDGRRLELVNNTVTTEVEPGQRELKFATKDGLYGSTRVDVPTGGSLKACFRFVDGQLKKC